jgi:uncharacterized protein YndB with AHSA1/START domain
MASFTLEREIAAPQETVFDLIVDHRGYAKITRLRKSELEREGDPAPNGVGAIRRLSSVGPPLREEILTYEEPSRYSYKLLSGLPVRDHVGTVELTPSGSGTKLTYAVRTIPTVPLVGPVVVGAVKLGVQQIIGAVAAEAERRAGADGR